MKKYAAIVILGLGLAGLFLNSPFIWADEIQADSKINKVVVYNDRALISRTTSINVQPGNHEIIFSGLPGSLEQDSVSAKGEGSAKVKLFGARVVTKQIEEAQSPRVKDLEAQLETLRDQEKHLQFTESILNEKNAFLASIRAAQGDQIGKDLVTRQPLADEIQKLVLFLDQEFLAVSQKQEQLGLDRQKLEKEIDVVQRELAQLQSGSSKQQISVAVDLEAASAGAFQLEISYRVPGASWQPVYEARAESDSTKVELTLSGMIQQNTGEDWKDVRLELSTAKPSVGGNMPEIQPWYLHKYEPPVPAPYAAGMMLSKTLAARQEMAPALDEIEGKKGYDAPAAPVAAEVASAQIESKGPSVQYVLPKSETILSDGQAKKSSIQSFSLPANLVHQTVPKLSPYAYLRAKVKNTSEGLLLPGSIQVFLQGAYIGNSWMKTVGTDEEFDLFLGVNEKIRVTQKLLSRKESISLIPGLKGKVKTIEYNYLTTIENYDGKEASVFLLDHVPMPQHSDIQMEFNANPGSTRSFDDKPGVFEWAFKIPAGQKQTVKLYFKIKHPEDLRIQGL